MTAVLLVPQKHPAQYCRAILQFSYFGYSRMVIINNCMKRVSIITAVSRRLNTKSLRAVVNWLIMQILLADREGVRLVTLLYVACRSRTVVTGSCSCRAKNSEEICVLLQYLLDLWFRAALSHLSYIIYNHQITLLFWSPLSSRPAISTFEECSASARADSFLNLYLITVTEFFITNCNLACN